MLKLLTRKKAVFFNGPAEERNLEREGDVEEVKEFASLAERRLRMKGEESSSRTRGSDYYGIGRAVMGWRGIEFKSGREFWW
ncbi:unnamed protein product [Prunus armeniaca]